MISKEDIEGFRYHPEKEDSEKYLRVKFIFETSDDPEWVAANLCSEQSTAQWAIPGESFDLRPRHAAKIVSCRVLGESKQPLYPVPSTKGCQRFLRCEVLVAHPHENFGASLPNLLSAIAGEGVFYAPGVHTIQLTDIDFPKSYLRQFEGPQFGVEGIRDALQVEERPIFIGVVKPNLGLAPERFAQLAESAWEGGLDIAKDDEMQGDLPWSALGTRVRFASQARKRAEAKTGRRKMFIANITSEVDESLGLAKIATHAGANIVMVNPIMTGLSVVRRLRRQIELPIMGHFAGVAAMGRLPYFGIYSPVYTKLMRLAGCDLIGVAGFGPRMQATEAEVLQSIDACLKPLGSLLPSLPIPGGSDWAGTLPDVYARIKHPDFGFIAGRGIFGHPAGPTAGAASVVQSWEAVSQGVSLEQKASTQPELQQALQAFS